jgi:hypothetical protein
MARAADVELNIDDFQMIADKTPFLADLMCVRAWNLVIIRINDISGPQGDITWRMSTRLVAFRLS